MRGESETELKPVHAAARNASLAADFCDAGASVCREVLYQDNGFREIVIEITLNCDSLSGKASTIVASIRPIFLGQD